MVVDLDICSHTGPLPAHTHGPREAKRHTTHVWNSRAFLEKGSWIIFRLPVAFFTTPLSGSRDGWGGMGVGCGQAGQHSGLVQGGSSCCLLRCPQTPSRTPYPSHHLTCAAAWALTHALAAVERALEHALALHPLNLGVA